MLVFLFTGMFVSKSGLIITQNITRIVINVTFARRAFLKKAVLQDTSELTPNHISVTIARRDLLKKAP